MYDMMVLVIAVAFLVRIGLKTGFRGYELPGLGGALVLISCYIFTATPTGLGATLIVSILILGRAGSWWRHQPLLRPAPRRLLGGVLGCRVPRCRFHHRAKHCKTILSSTLNSCSLLQSDKPSFRSKC
jgi:hypothetical protein